MEKCLLKHFLKRTFRCLDVESPFSHHQQGRIDFNTVFSRTGGCHCRGGGRCGLPPRTRALRTSPRALAPWAPGSVFEADVFNPLIEFLEQGIIIRFLVIKDKLS